jgi:glycosyltransferase involved in cell wall biosynthesis
LKILVINYAYFVTGGPERYLFNLTNLLEDNGHTVIPFSIDLKENLSTKYSKYFVSSINTDRSFYFSSKTTFKEKIKQITRLIYSPEVEFKLLKLLQVERPDVAYILHYQKKMSPAVLTACKKMNVPIVVRISDYLSMCPARIFVRKNKICEECKRGVWRSVKYRCVHDSYVASILWFLASRYHRARHYDRLIDALVVTNDFMKNKLIEFGNSTKKSLIPTFVNDNSNRMVSYKHKLKHNQICMIGNLNKMKGIDLLLQAYSKLLTKGTRIKLVIMGNDLEGEYAKYCSDNAGLSKNIEYHDHGSFDLVLKTLSDSLFLIFPVQGYDNLPNIVMESYSVGTPVIGTAIGSINEMIDDSKTGYKCEYGNSQDLMSVISKAINIDADTYESMQRACLLKAKHVYSREMHSDKLINLFQDTIAHSNLKLVQ